MSLCKERGKKHLVQDKLTFHLWAKLDYLVLLIGGREGKNQMPHTLNTVTVCKWM